MYVLIYLTAATGIACSGIIGGNLECENPIKCSDWLLKPYWGRDDLYDPIDELCCGFICSKCLVSSGPLKLGIYGGVAVKKPSIFY